jgi:hypothetical protein
VKAAHKMLVKLTPAATETEIVTYPVCCNTSKILPMNEYKVSSYLVPRYESHWFGYLYIIKSTILITRACIIVNCKWGLIMQKIDL